MVRVHLTFLLLLVWIAAGGYLVGGVASAVASSVFIVLLFGCVVLHELGHALVARRFGVRTPSITLLPIGGVARLERIPDKPREELAIALAGPAVNIVLAAVFFLILRGAVPARWLEPNAPVTALLVQLAVANVVLAVFNLLPAFPMDGGRVLRALLALRLGHARATHVAARVGQGMAFAFGIFGLLYNPFLLFIALFVYIGAVAEESGEQMQQAARSLLAGEAAVTRFATLSPTSRLEDALESLVHTSQHLFPVVDGGGSLRGILTQEAIVRASGERGPDTPVIDLMIRDVPRIAPRASLSDALGRLQDRETPAVAVVDAAGGLRGMITRESLGQLMLVQAARAAA